MDVPKFLMRIIYKSAVVNKNTEVFQGISSKINAPSQLTLIITDESPAILNVILRSLTVNYGSVY